MLVVAKMSDTVLFSFVIFLGSHWGTEPLSIAVTEGVENNVSSSSKHLEEDMAKLFDEIVLQVFSSSVDDGRLITRRDVNETYSYHNGVSASEFVSSSHKQDDYLDKIFDEILWQVLSNDSKYLPKEDEKTADELLMGKDSNQTHIAEKNNEPSLFSRDVQNQLSAVGKETLQKNTQEVYRDDLHCGQLLSFLQKNIIFASVAMAAILLATVLVVLVVVTCIRRRHLKFPPASMTYNIFIMNGKAWWQNPQDKQVKKFTGKQKRLEYPSFV